MHPTSATQVLGLRTCDCYAQGLPLKIIFFNVLKRGSSYVTGCAKGHPAEGSSFLSVWVLGMELRRSGLAANALTRVNFISISPSFITRKNNP